VSAFDGDLTTAAGRVRFALGDWSAAFIEDEQIDALVDSAGSEDAALLQIRRSLYAMLSLQPRKFTVAGLSVDYTDIVSGLRAAIDTADGVGTGGSVRLDFQSGGDW
jgi:hypothetical protein